MGQKRRSPIQRYLKAFTLVELLVAIGIIVVLIAILVPACVRARGQARRVVCAAQIGQILQANGIYIGDNKRLIWVGDYSASDHFAHASADSSVFIDNGLEPIRFGKLIPAIKIKRELFFCPASPLTEPGYDPRMFGINTAPPDSVVGTYAQRGARQGGPSRPVELKRGMALISDFEYRDRVGAGLQWVLAHGNGLNAGYSDGHVSFVGGTFDSFYYSFGGDGQRGRLKGTWRLLDEEAGVAPK